MIYSSSYLDLVDEAKSEFICFSSDTLRYFLEICESPVNSIGAEVMARAIGQILTERSEWE